VMRMPPRSGEGEEEEEEEEELVGRFDYGKRAQEIRSKGFGGSGSGTMANGPHGNVTEGPGQQKGESGGDWGRQSLRRRRGLRVGSVDKAGEFTHQVSPTVPRKQKPSHPLHRSVDKKYGVLNLLPALQPNNATPTEEYYGIDLRTGRAITQLVQAETVAPQIQDTMNQNQPRPSVSKFP
jgi:hypothetical protein